MTFCFMTLLEIYATIVYLTYHLDCVHVSMGIVLSLFRASCLIREGNIVI